MERLEDEAIVTFTSRVCFHCSCSDSVELACNYTEPDLPVPVHHIAEVVSYTLCDGILQTCLVQCSLQSQQTIQSLDLIK